MTIEMPGRTDLSEDAIRAYGLIARRDPAVTKHTAGMAELEAWGLIGSDPEQDGTPIALHPQDVLRQRLAGRLETAVDLIQDALSMPSLSDRLAGHYAAAQWGITARSEFLPDRAVVNARIAAVVGAARSEILTSQPGGPRSRELLTIAVGRDTEALERGVKIRSLYRGTVRTDALTSEYARTMSAMGAEYRTVVCPFTKCVIVDREHAFIRNYMVEDGGDYTAWHITSRASVTWMAHVWEAEWRRADPWSGELRSRRGERDGCEPAADGVRTTRRQREILRDITADIPQAKSAKNLGISQRQLTKELAVLKQMFGVETLPALCYQWALSPDRLVDESAPTESTAGANADGLSGVAA